MSVTLIATALSSIGSALARRGLDLLSGVFRGAVDKGTEEIAELIKEKTGIDINDAAEDKLSDEQWTKLKEFELQYQVQLLEYRQQADAMDLERERLHQADRESARDLQRAALASDDTFSKRFVYYYAVGITLLSFGFIYYAAFFFNFTKDNTEAVRIIDTVIGFLLGVSLSAIIQYFFGSSAGSKSKEEKLKELADAPRIH